MKSQRDRNDAFGDKDAEIIELQRRLATLTAALSEKAEENLDLAASLRERDASEEGLSERRVRELETELVKMRRERAAQEELNTEFQRRIATLSVCLAELAEVNHQALSGSGRSGLERQNEAAHAMGRQAALGLVQLDDAEALSRRGPLAAAAGNDNNVVAGSSSGLSDSSESSSLAGVASPVTPQLLQDYQGEIERLKFRLRKCKAKVKQLRDDVVLERDRSDAAVLAVKKYEKELKRLQSEAETALVKEASRRAKIEQAGKAVQRRVSELEFLLESAEKK